MTKEEVLVKSLVELTDTLVDDFDVVDLLTRLAGHCVSVLDVQASGIMLIGLDGHLRVMASSSEEMRVLELFELQEQEGPCVDCYRTGHLVSQETASGTERWPLFAAEAMEAGFQSVHAIPMRLRGSIIGALNLFRNDTGTLSSSEVEIAQAFADVATIAILQHQAAVEAQVVNAQLTHALNARVVIEQAKGMLAERLGLEMGQAFDKLRTYARNGNLRLAVVAEDVINGKLAANDLG